MYSHTYNSWRYSTLNQINVETVKNLHVKQAAIDFAAAVEGTRWITIFVHP